MIETSLAGVRDALKTPGLRLQNLYDRRLLVATMMRRSALSQSYYRFNNRISDSLTARVSREYTSLLDECSKSTNQFCGHACSGYCTCTDYECIVVGTGVIYVTALFLGIIFGAILSATAVPTLAFTSLSAGGVLSSLSSDEFYVFQRIIPAQVVIPLSLGIAFATLVATVSLLYGSWQASLCDHLCPRRYVSTRIKRPNNSGSRAT